jgi:hypothetical protein
VRTSGNFVESCVSVSRLSLTFVRFRQDFYIFNAGLLHEVPIVPDAGETRIVLATFIGYSETDPEIFVWS